MSLDLINRDPNCINNHIQCAFEDVLAEPEGVQSIDCVWKLSHTCFECWKNCCYKMITLLCGCCIAAQLGCEFAFIAFSHVWQYTPALKSLEINCHYYRKCYSLVLSCAVDPCCISCGQIFHAFKKS